MTSLSSNDAISLTRAEPSGSLKSRVRVPSELQAETSFGSPGAFSTSSSSYKSGRLAREEEDSRTLFEAIDGDPTMNTPPQPLLFTSDSLPSYRRAKAKSHRSLLRTDSHQDRLSTSYRAEDEASSLLARDQLQLEHVEGTEDSEGGRGADEREGEEQVTPFGTFSSGSGTKKIARGGRWYKLKRRINMKILKK